MNTGRIALLGGMILAAVTRGLFAAVPAPDYWPTQGWRETSPEQQGIDSQKLSAIFPFVEEKDVPIHSLLLIRNDWIQFVLDQPLRSRPGTEFFYSSSAMHLLAATLSVSTRMSPLDFAHTSFSNR